MKKPNIVLIGFMGSGKSSLGRWIAKNHDYELIDTDEAIEKRKAEASVIYLRLMVKTTSEI